MPNEKKVETQLGSFVPTPQPRPPFTSHKAGNKSKVNINAHINIE
jgi:hypothetical protein